MIRFRANERRPSLTLGTYCEGSPGMLFLVISQPLPTRPSEVADDRRRFWDWAQPLIDDGEVRHVYVRVGRGAVAVLEVASNERLHALLNEWCDIVPAEFQVYPLVDAEAMQQFLATQP